MEFKMATLSAESPSLSGYVLSRGEKKDKSISIYHPEVRNLKTK